MPRLLTRGVLGASLLIALAGCSDGEPAPFGFVGFVNISGTAVYEDIGHRVEAGAASFDWASTTEVPIRSCVVEAAINGAVFASVRTAEDGSFSLQVPADNQVLLRVVSVLRTADGDDYAEVSGATDNGRQRYSIGQNLTVASSNLNTRLVARHDSSAATYTPQHGAGAFAILDVVEQCRRGIAAVSDGDAALPSLEIHWESAITSSSYDIGLRILEIAGNASDPDEYDRAVIAHEWSHYFLNSVSADSSRGGSHPLGALLDETVAYSEGMATALGLSLLGDSLYIDANTSVDGAGLVYDVEADRWGPGQGTERLGDGAVIPIDGPHSEASVHQTVWDLIDPVDANDADDQVALGLAPIVDLLTADTFDDTVYPITIFHFLQRLRSVRTAEADLITRLAQREKIEIPAAGAIHQDPALSYGPRYRELQVEAEEPADTDGDGRPLQTWSDLGSLANEVPNAENIKASKLFNQQRFVTPALDTGLYQITVTPAEGNTVVLFPPHLGLESVITSTANGTGPDEVPISVGDEASDDIASGRRLAFSVTSVQQEVSFTVAITRLDGSG